MRAKEYIACSEASLKHPAEIRQIIDEMLPLRSSRQQTADYYNRKLIADIRLQACLLQKELYEKNNAMQTAEPEEFQMKDSSSFFTIIPNVNYGLTDADFQRIIDANGGKDETIERYPEIGVGDLGSTTHKLPKKTTHKLPKRTTHKQTDKQLGTTSQLIIDTLVDDPLATMDKLAAIMGISPDGVKWQLDKLKKEGYIERQGSRRSGTWKVLIKK